MTFTYTSDLTVDRDFVRFHSGDVVKDESYLSDEIITSLLAVNDTKQEATISAIEHIITRLSTPNFRADWLQVTKHEARQGYENMLTRKRSEFGLPLFSVSTKRTYRGDGREGIEQGITE